MEEKYLIEGSTLKATADALRKKEESEEKINPIEFASKIMNIDLPTREYMTIYDLVFGNNTNYTQREIDEVDYYINYFGGGNNG